MLESRIEAETCRLLRQAGAEPVKVGRDGWPDRLVLTGDGRHFWIEFKQVRGPLRMNQKVRLAQLAKRGDRVVIVREIPLPAEVAFWLSGGSLPDPG